MIAKTTVNKSQNFKLQINFKIEINIIIILKIYG